MAIVNVAKLYYSTITKDELGASNLVFGTPVYLPGVRQIDAKVQTSTEKLYAEGKVWEQSSTLENVELAVEMADISNADYAIMLGHKLATQGGVIAMSDDVAPYVALLAEFDKSNGEKSYRIFYKGKFNEPDSDGGKTKEDKVEFQTKKITCTFQPLINNSMWKYQVDSDDPSCPADIESTFFNSVIVPTVKAA